MLEIKKYQKVSINSEKNFGIVFSFFFIIVFSYYAFFKDKNFYWLIYVSFFFLLFSFIKPNIFYLPNKIWFKIGIILGYIITPIILFIMFYFIITPYGFVVKIFKKNLLNKKIDKNKKTYWITRNSSINTMKDQY